MKILIIKLSSLGDVVHAIPLASALKKILPEAQIDWLVYESFAGILQESKTLTNIHVLKYKTFSALLDKALELRKEKYDLVIDLQALMKTAFLSWLIRSPNLGYQEPREYLARFFYQHRANLGKILDNSTHIVEKNLLMAKKAVEVLCPHHDLVKYGIPFDFDHLKPPTIFIKKSTGKVCIIPSTTWETKFWANESWIEVLKFLFEKHRSKVYLLGTDKDLEKISGMIKNLINHGSIKLYKNGEALNPQCSSNYTLEIITNKKLSELPDFFRDMDLILGVDTGPLHIAAASCFINGALEIKSDKNLFVHKQTLPIKIIGLLGPSSGRRTGPYGFEYLSADEISGLKANQKRKLAGKINMMQFIKPEMVLDRL